MKHPDSTKGFALITGASSGIGKAIAFEIARAGVDLILIALPNTGLEAVAASIRELYRVTVLCYSIDLTSDEAAEQVKEWCASNSLEIHTVVNNAGFGNVEPFEFTDLQTLDRMMTLNMNAVVRLSHHFIPFLKKFKRSYMLNVSSLAAFFCIPNKSVYAASKLFISHFSHSLRSELAGYGISVSCLHPGSTLTGANVRKNIQAIGYKPDTFCQTPEYVARKAVRQMWRGQRTIVPGWQNQLIMMLNTIIPTPIKQKIVERIFEKEKRRTKMFPSCRSYPLGVI